MTPDTFKELRENIGRDTGMDKHTIPPPTDGQQIVAARELIMSEHEHEEIFRRLSAIMEPVLEASRLNLVQMADAKVTSFEITALKERLDKIERASERAAEDRHEILRAIAKLELSVATSLADKASRTDVDTVKHEAHKHELSTAKIIGGVITLSGLSGAISALIVAWFKSSPSK